MSAATELRKQSILLVSNRLPVTLARGPGGLEMGPSAGGLISALDSVLRRHGGTWVGWPGIEIAPGEALPPADVPYRLRPVSVTDADVEDYYHGFANGTLWPLFHCFVEQSHFDRMQWETYERVNEQFAEVAAAAAEGAGLVWIHDYHLLLAAPHLRRALPQTRIAFFLHIPFPPYDIFRLLPWGPQLLRGMLACNLIGFHVDNYARNFLDCAERLLGVRVDRSAYLVEHGEGAVRVGSFSLGVDFDLFESRALAAPRSSLASRERVILGVDRLDYTKGLPERILAWERLLERHPQHREKVVLLQIAVPRNFEDPDYHRLKRQVDQLVGRVNGRLATATWSPIRYLYRSVAPETLAGLYRDADVCMVTPLRDGMNVVAKEFVCCQVRDPGVLLLSRLAGAAETMHEAVLVNPYNIDETAEALHRALEMNEAERQSRLAALRRRERRYNLEDWLQRFLEAALAGQLGFEPPSDGDFESWLGPFLSRYRLALFLDYDGTLASIADHPSRASMSSPMRKVFEACARRGDTDVTIVSGRSLKDIRAIVDHARVTYAANHGLESAGPALPYSRHPDVDYYEARAAALAESLTAVAPPGAWAELKGPSLTFHYRGVDIANRDQLEDEVSAIIAEAGFQPRQVRSALEARPPIGWDKGHAMLHILRTRYGPSWPEKVRVIYLGDDVTDEDAFRLLRGLGVTFRVGGADTLTAASRRLANLDAVRALLDWLARRPPPSAGDDRALIEGWTATSAEGPTAG